MKKRRKHKACLNCGELLNQKHNYCPVCGQENTDNQVSIGLLLREFTSNFFSLDSRFGRTLKPFLINPGALTLAFNEGKRVRYANPIRWYLVISILHFFLLAQVNEPSVRDKKQLGFMSEIELLTPAEFDSISHYPDTSASVDWPLSSNKLKLVRHLNESVDLTPSQIMDTLRLNGQPFLQRFASKQLIKIQQETTASINGYIMRQIPLIIFFILPIYAVLLKLFFWRKGLYIKHLIHSIHLHSFFFFSLACVWVVTLFYKGFQGVGIAITFFLTTVYIVKSFKRVYNVKHIWSLFRLMLIGFFYTFLLSVVFGIGVLISLALL